MITLLEGFAGPGGLSEAARMVGITDTIGVEKNADACATAVAAGYDRIQTDIRDLDPDGLTGVVGWVSGPPCPTYSDSGLQSGRGDYDKVLAGSSNLGETLEVDPANDPYAETYTAVEDERSALVLETLRFALRLPDLEWLVAEQVPAVERIWLDFAAELSMTYWKACSVITLRADDFGAPNRRSRVFLIAARSHVPDFAGMPIRAWWQAGRFTEPWTPAPVMVTPFPKISMAEALGWPEGVRVNTRGGRKTAGGNEFSADGPAPGLTYTARTWYRTDLGSVDGRIGSREAGLLQGFPTGYPWRGSRTSQFQRVADSVSPLMGAAVLGAASGRPWRDAVWRRLGELYEREPTGQYRLCSTGRGRPGQPDLFGEAA